MALRKMLSLGAAGEEPAMSTISGATAFDFEGRAARTETKETSFIIIFFLCKDFFRVGGWMNSVDSLFI
jgi:hypothetical protein